MNNFQANLCAGGVRIRLDVIFKSTIHWMPVEKMLQKYCIIHQNVESKIEEGPPQTESACNNHSFACAANHNIRENSTATTLCLYTGFNDDVVIMHSISEPQMQMATTKIGESTILPISLRRPLGFIMSNCG